MCGIVGSVVTLVVGAVLIVATTTFSYVFLPQIVDNVIEGEVTLISDTIQFERFQVQPFAVNFTIRLFNVTNVEDVLAGGVPVVQEVGPYTYKLYQSREIESMTENTVSYRRVERFEFDPVSSFPNTEDDLVTIINVPYHAIMQVAESLFPNLLSILNLALNGVFGAYNSPFATFRVQDLLFDGIPICANPGLIGGIACGIIRDFAQDTMNIQEVEGGSLAFSVLNYKEIAPSEIYNVSRGLEDSSTLGDIFTLAGEPYFNYWTNTEQGEDGEEIISVCNYINGTDAGIFAPFVDRSKSIYSINTDICRSVELRYQYDTEYEGIPSVRYTSNEWLLDNDDGCFCLNVTSGVTREDGCLLKGAMELFSCVGAFLVMSYPHFLYGDPIYRDGVIGMNPIEEQHRIFLDLEPNTGTPVRGAKRAQFNIFMRPVTGIPPTQTLRTTLMPIFWVDEGVSLPEEYVDEITNKLLRSLRLVDIIVPVLITLSCLVAALGVVFLVRAKLRKPTDKVLSSGVHPRSA